MPNITVIPVELHDTETFPVSSFSCVKEANKQTNKQVNKRKQTNKQQKTPSSACGNSSHTNSVQPNVKYTCVHATRSSPGAGVQIAATLLGFLQRKHHLSRSRCQNSRNRDASVCGPCPGSSRQRANGCCVFTVQPQSGSPATVATACWESFVVLSAESWRID